MVIDAKYKGDPYQEGIETANSDVYQVITAARAAGASKCMLVYPSRPSRSLEIWDISGSGNPTLLFLVGLDPLTLSRRDGVREVLSQLETSIEGALAVG